MAGRLLDAGGTPLPQEAVGSGRHGLLEREHQPHARLGGRVVEATVTGQLVAGEGFEGRGETVGGDVVQVEDQGRQGTDCSVADAVLVLVQDHGRPQVAVLLFAEDVVLDAGERGGPGKLSSVGGWVGETGEENSGQHGHRHRQLRGAIGRRAGVGEQQDGRARDFPAGRVAPPIPLHPVCPDGGEG